MVIKRKGWAEGARQLSRAQRDALFQANDWTSETDAPQLPVPVTRGQDIPRGPSFVSPGPAAPVPVRVTRLDPVQPHEVTPAAPATIQQIVRTSEVDRAKGFTLSTVPLAATAGVVAGLLAITVGGVPILSGALLTVIFMTFAGVWAAAYAWNQSTSPGGLGLWSIILHYRLLRYEQRARVERLRGGQDDR